MDYSEAVKGKISGEGDELDRRTELWRRIDSAYREGGENAIKGVIVESSDSISGEFEKLLRQLREKL